MRVIIAGSRHVSSYRLVRTVIEMANFDITEVVSGGAYGVDQLGERWAHFNQIPLAIHSADWDTYGKAAGPIRNKNMAQNADALIAIQTNSSRGTQNMIEEAKMAGLSTYVFRFEIQAIDASDINQKYEMDCPQCGHSVFFEANKDNNKYIDYSCSYCGTEGTKTLDTGDN